LDYVVFPGKIFRVPVIVLGLIVHNSKFRYKRSAFKLEFGKIAIRTYILTTINLI
jgi:hypothetical protein